MTKSLRLSTLLALGLSLALGGCAPGSIEEEDDDAESEESFLKNVEKTGGKSQKWIYEGWMPALEQTSVTVSLKGHTARVSGLLPFGYSEPLPFYAKTSAAADARTRVTVVYPIATGAIDPSTGEAPAGPGLYNYLTAVPFTPTNDKAAWGGFPFMKYHQSRGLAFHGPITSKRNAETGDWEWLLTRGPVSHGCNRMQGEHVVELAHVLGLDMSAPHSSGEVKKLTTPVNVLSDYDQLEGQWIDVDYPTHPAVKRPTGNVAMYRTWDSRNLPQLVCAYDSTRPLDGAHCANIGEILQDIATGEMLVQAAAPTSSWMGSSCASDADCSFTADGEAGHCMKDGSSGFCSVSCEGYCADKSGHAPTFCAATPAGEGACMAKAAVENEGCATIAGTEPVSRSRFIGSSGASEKVATVCSF